MDVTHAIGGQDRAATRGGPRPGADAAGGMVVPGAGDQDLQIWQRHRLGGGHAGHHLQLDVPPAVRGTIPDPPPEPIV